MIRRTAISHTGHLAGMRDIQLKGNIPLYWITLIPAKMAGMRDIHNVSHASQNGQNNDLLNDCPSYRWPL